MVVLLNEITRIKNKYPDDETPVTYDVDNNILSRFKDDVWDFTSYRISRGNPKIYFNFDDELNKQIKHILYYFVYIRKGSPGLRTIKNFFNVLNVLAKLCEKFNNSFISMSSNRILFNFLVNKINDLEKYTAKSYLSCINTIGLAGEEFNLNYGLDKKDLKLIRKNVKKINDDVKQTALIPTRILSEFIMLCTQKINEYHCVLDEMENFFNTDQYFQRNDINNRTNVLFKNIPSSEALKGYFKKNGIQIRSNLIKHLGELQSIASCLISCFSGMRKSELEILPYDSLQLINVDNKEVYVFQGFTKKLSKVGVVRCNWITSKSMVEVNLVLQSIARIHKIWSSKNSISKLINNLEISKYPLLPLFNIFGNSKVLENEIYKIPTLYKSYIGEIIYQTIEEIIVNEDDIAELYEFNPLIDWENKYSIQLGSPWKFVYHQFRRSLAVYSARSGIVKIPSLKQQLKHISLDMTFYYANDYSYANGMNFEEEFCKEFRIELTNARAWMYQKQVIDNKEILFGGEGTRIQNIKDSNNLPSFFKDNNELIKMVNEGQISYKETPLGGCSSINGCNKLGIFHIASCITCADAIFDSKTIDKLHKLKDHLQMQLQKYEYSSIFYNQITAEITSIDKLLSKVNF